MKFNLNLRALSYGFLSASVLGFFLCPDVFARTNGDFSTEIEMAETLITGGIARVGLIGLCLIVTGVAMAKQSIMGVIFGVGGAFFFYMMKDWIDTAFPMII